jgi:RNA polymerase sigma-70 factor (ECF subfamily)
MPAGDRELDGGGGLDPESQAWIDGLRSSGPERAAALGRLHDLLWGAARREAARRSGSVGSPGLDPVFFPADLDVLAREATADAVRLISADLGAFGGESRFTTWACKFAVSAVSEGSARAAAARRGRGGGELLGIASWPPWRPAA